MRHWQGEPVAECLNSAAVTGGFFSSYSRPESKLTALTDPPRAVGFLGTAEDRADLAGRGVIVSNDEFSELACTGLDDWRDDPRDYRGLLAEWASSGILMHCLNPDRVVIHCGRREACAGALADIYEEPERTVIVSEVAHAILAHNVNERCLTLEAGIVKVADALDMTKGRSRKAITAGKIDIHSISAAAVEAVR